MTAKQHQATLENPNNLKLTEVTRYERTICANKDRVWENVIDWEHLPHLHNTSFSYAELDDAGDWGWRIWSDQEHHSHVELCYDMPNNRYVARSYKGIQQVSEIWTTVTPTDQTTVIEVQFLVPDVPEEKVASVGKFFQKLYSKLWDEDEAMMIERQTQLDKQSELHPLKIDLGYEDELFTSLPRYIDLKRGRYRVIAVDGQLKVHSVVCPHILGPLNSEVIDNKITCPWHGYQFDLDTGTCVSPASASCRLSKAPQISVSKEPRPRVQVGFTSTF